MWRNWAKRKQNHNLTLTGHPPDKKLPSRCLCTGSDILSGGGMLGLGVFAWKKERKIRLLSFCDWAWKLWWVVDRARRNPLKLGSHLCLHVSATATAAVQVLSDERAVFVELHWIRFTILEQRRLVISAKWCFWRQRRAARLQWRLFSEQKT